MQLKGVAKEGMEMKRSAGGAIPRARTEKQSSSAERCGLIPEEMDKEEEAVFSGPCRSKMGMYLSNDSAASDKGGAGIEADERDESVLLAAGGHAVLLKTGRERI